MFSSVARLMLALINVKVFNVATAKLAMDDGREKLPSHPNRIKFMKSQWRRSSELLVNQSPIKVNISLHGQTKANRSKKKNTKYMTTKNSEKKKLVRMRSLFFGLPNFFPIHFNHDPFFGWFVPMIEWFFFFVLFLPFNFFHAQFFFMRFTLY